MSQEDKMPGLDAIRYANEVLGAIKRDFENEIAQVVREMRTRYTLKTDEAGQIGAAQALLRPITSGLEALESCLFSIYLSEKAKFEPEKIDGPT